MFSSPARPVISLRPSFPSSSRAGHDVTGLARSEQAAAAVAALGATAHRGDLDDLDGLTKAAADSNGVVHLAFKHDEIRTGNFAGAVAAELAVVQALGDGLAGTGKPLVGSSGTLMLAHLGRTGTEEDAAVPGGRGDAEIATLGLAERDVRASVVRIPPITHSMLDRHGFARTLIAIARQTGIARLRRGRSEPVARRAHPRRRPSLLPGAREGAGWHPRGTRPGTRASRCASSPRASATTWASRPRASRTASWRRTSGSSRGLIALDNPTSTATTRRVLGWEPAHPGLLADFDDGDYFAGG